MGFAVLRQGVWSVHGEGFSTRGGLAGEGYAAVKRHQSVPANVQQQKGGSTKRRQRCVLQIRGQREWEQQRKVESPEITTRQKKGYLRSLIQFLVEQPGELRYIEWPSFKSTLRTATLTLVLVALLIVALSSVDAALWYLLALILRRSA